MECLASINDVASFYLTSRLIACVFGFATKFWTSFTEPIDISNE